MKADASGSSGSCARLDPTTRPRCCSASPRSRSPTHIAADSPDARAGAHPPPMRGRCSPLGRDVALVVAALLSLQRGDHAASSTIRAAIASRSTAAPAFRSRTTGRRSTTAAQTLATEAVPFDILLHRDTRHGPALESSWYFVVGRFSGLLPYFFPGVRGGWAVPRVAAAIASPGSGSCAGGARGRCGRLCCATCRSPIRAAAGRSATATS